MLRKQEIDRANPVWPDNRLQIGAVVYQLRDGVGDLCLLAVTGLRDSEPRRGRVALVAEPGSVDRMALKAAIAAVLVRYLLVSARPVPEVTKKIAVRVGCINPIGLSTGAVRG